MLSHERSGIAGVARSKRAIERLREIAKTEQVGGSSLSEDKEFNKKISEVEIDLMALEYTELRTLASESAGKGPGPEASLLKIRGTEIGQQITELVLEATGYYGMPFRNGPVIEGSNVFPVGPDYAGGAAPTYLNMRKTSIFGGSNEIQHNIIAKAVLGL